MPIYFNKDKSPRDLNSDISMISEQVFQWKMQFHPDLNKQAIEVCFLGNVVIIFL